MSRALNADPPLGNGLSKAEFTSGRDFALSYARERFSTEEGSFLEQPIRWSDQDPFRHLNNAKCASYFEAGRVLLDDAMKPRFTAERDKKQSFAVARLTIDFVAPCQAPDTVLVCHRITEVSERGFLMEGSMISYRTKRVVATSTADMRAFNTREQKCALLRDCEDQQRRRTEAIAYLRNTWRNSRGGSNLYHLLLYHCGRKPNCDHASDTETPLPISPRPPEANLPRDGLQSSRQPVHQGSDSSSSRFAPPASRSSLGRYMEMPLARDVSPRWDFAETARAGGRAQSVPISAAHDVFEDYDYAPLEEAHWDESTTDEAAADDQSSMGSLIFGDEAAEMEYMMLRDEVRHRRRARQRDGSTLLPHDSEIDLEALDPRTADGRTAESNQDRQRRAASIIDEQIAAFERLSGSAEIDRDQLRRQTAILNQGAIEIAAANELCGAMAPQPSFIEHPISDALHLIHAAASRPGALRFLQSLLAGAVMVLQDLELRRAHNQLMTMEDLRYGVHSRLLTAYERLIRGDADWLQPRDDSPVWARDGRPASSELFASLGIATAHPDRFWLDRIKPALMANCRETSVTAMADSDADLPEVEEAIRASIGISTASQPTQRSDASTSSLAKAPALPVKLGPVLHLGQPKDNILPCSFLRAGGVFTGQQAYSKAFADKGPSQPRRKRRTSEPQPATPVPSSSVDLLPLARRGRRLASIGTAAVPYQRVEAPRHATLPPMRAMPVVEGYEELDCIITEDAARIMRSKAHDSWTVRVCLHSVDLEKGTVHGVMHALDVRKLCSVDAGATLPKVTTVFDGEIVDGHNFSIWTNKWGCEKSHDVHNWSSLRAFEGLGEGMVELGRAREGYILMRWKERAFLNMDAKTSGLTISGFYHVAMHRSSGAIEALYFDPTSSPFQRMTLTPAPCSGQFSVQ